MDFKQLDSILERHGIQHDPAFDNLKVAIAPLPYPYNDGQTLGLYYPDADRALGIEGGTTIFPPDCDEDTVLHEFGHRKGHVLTGDLSEQAAEQYRISMKSRQPVRRWKPVRAAADFNLSSLNMSVPVSLNTDDQIMVNVSCQVDDILANFPDEWQVCVAIAAPALTSSKFSVIKSSTAGARYPFDTRISPYLVFPMGNMPADNQVAITVIILANHDDRVPFDFSIIDYGGSSWDILSETVFFINNSTINPNPVDGSGGYTPIAKATSFDTLSQNLSTSRQQLKHGDKIRFVLNMSQPVAHAFDLAGAELIFRPIMPPGIILDDVYSIDASTVGIDAHATSPMFAAIGAWLAANWVYVTLGAIGITIALGLLVAGVAFLVLAVGSPQTIAETSKWVAIGLGAVAVGLIGYGIVKSRQLAR